MLFSDYVNILKSHFRKTISNERLCGILFNAVVEPLDLLNKENEPYILDKATVSKLMNDKQGVPRLIRDNAYEPAVLSGIVGYFNESVVSELVPETDDLCFQLMESLRVDGAISPKRLAGFQMLAESATVDAFLAEIFLYVALADVHDIGKRGARQEAAPSEQDVKIAPNLSLRGIADGRLSDFAEAEDVSRRPGFDLTEYRDEIAGLFEKASSMHPPKPNMYGTVLSPHLVKLDENDIKLLEAAARFLDITLPDDFFDLGDLTESAFAAGVFGHAAMTGSPDARSKHKTIREIIESLENMLRAAPLIDSLNRVGCIELALENNGNGFDEQVRVRLEIPKEALFSVDDFLSLDEGTLGYLVGDFDFNGAFGISRGSEFLDFDSSLRHRRPFDFQTFNSAGFYWEQTSDYRRDVSNLLEYEMIENKGIIQIEVEFDEVLQHTVVAFPQVILLKSSPSSIEYSITSKHMPNACVGSLSVRTERWLRK